MDTVKLDGKGFTPKVQQNDTVTKGQLLLEFDIDTIKAAGLETATPVIVTNTCDYEDIVCTDVAQANNGDEILHLL